MYVCRTYLCIHIFTLRFVLNIINGEAYILLKADWKNGIRLELKEQWKAVGVMYLLGNDDEYLLFYHKWIFIYMKTIPKSYIKYAILSLNKILISYFKY